MTLSDTPSYCMFSSKTMGEQLYGTAVHARVWLLIEYSDSWASKAIEESNLPPVVKQWLLEMPNQIEGARVQFIKQEGRQAESITVFVAITDELAPRLYELNAPSYPALTALDIKAMVNNDSAMDTYLRDEPLYIVCTNGRRDICCAKFGLATYHQLAELVEENAWQTTHLGGHRFASTAVCLPHGLAYGWIDRDAAQIVEDYEQSRINLSHYRGRTLYPPIVQVAEYALRNKLGVVAIEAYTLVKIIDQTNGYWEVDFRDMANGDEYQVILLEYTSPFQVFKSSADTQAVNVIQHDILSIAKL